MLLLIELISDVKTGTHANKLDNRQSIGKTCDWKYFPDRNSLKESVQNLDIAEEEETLYICAEYL